METTTRISVDEVLEGRLPERATGVRWTDTEWTECRDHLEDASWAHAMVTQRSDAPTGIVLFCEVECDACAEARDA